MLDPRGGGDKRGELVEYIGLICSRVAIVQPWHAGIHMTPD